MLSPGQLRFPLLAYSVCSYFGLLPLWIDSKNCRIQVRSYSFRWKLQFGWFLLRAGLGMWRALDALVLQPQAESLAYSPVLILTVISTLVTAHSAYFAFVKYPEVLVTIFNSLFDQNGRTGRNMKPWMNMTIQEIAVLLSPWNIPIVAVMYGFILVMYPFAPFSPNLFLPNMLRTKVIVGIVCIMEITYAAFLMSTLMFISVILLCFFQKCMEDGRHLRGRVKTL